jgi:hypothetical protein
VVYNQTDKPTATSPLKPRKPCGLAIRPAGASVSSKSASSTDQGNGNGAPSKTAEAAASDASAGGCSAKQPPKEDAAGIASHALQLEADCRSTQGSCSLPASPRRVSARSWAQGSALGSVSPTRRTEQSGVESPACTSLCPAAAQRYVGGILLRDDSDTHERSALEAPKEDQAGGGAAHDTASVQPAPCRLCP